MVQMPTLEEFDALKQALADMAGELRITRAERDLLKEKLAKFTRKFFAASSEAAVLQKDLFFNEAESLGAQAEPAAEESDSPDAGGNDGAKIDVPGHQRIKRGRKPLDPALPRE
jgi:hypothetical protein